MKSPPRSLRLLSIVVLIGTCASSGSIISTARAGGYRGCGCVPYGGGYYFGRANFSYSRTRFSIFRRNSFRQGFGSPHPRSLIGRYGFGRSFGYPYGGYASSVIPSSRFGGFFPFRSAGSTLQYRRSLGNLGGFGIPRYRLHFGQSAVPGQGQSSLDQFQFVSRGNSFGSIPADSGWLLLSEGQPAHAAASFDKRISENPGNMTAKVGLALSLASAGDLTAGAWHMRQACSSDVGVLKLVLLNDQLRHQLEHLVGNYKKSLSKYSAGRQAHFMLAALNYLAEDKDAAAVAVANAIRNGDRTAVARHLQELIKDFDAGRQAALVRN